MVPRLCTLRWYQTVREGTGRNREVLSIQALPAKTASLLVFSLSLESGSNPVRDAFRLFPAFHRQRQPIRADCPRHAIVLELFP